MPDDKVHKSRKAEGYRSVKEPLTASIAAFAMDVPNIGVVEITDCADISGAEIPAQPGLGDNRVAIIVIDNRPGMMEGAMYRATPRGARAFADGIVRIADRIDPAGAAEPAPQGPKDPWLNLETYPQGEIVWLLVDYRGEDASHALVDNQFGATLGGKFSDEPDAEWKLAGWCWTHDHFTEGHGRVIAWKPVGFSLEPPACFRPIDNTTVN